MSTLDVHRASKTSMGFLLVLFHISTETFHFVPEELLGGIVGEFTIRQGKRISQGLEFWFQVLQVEDSCKIQE